MKKRKYTTTNRISRLRRRQHTIAIQKSKRKEQDKHWLEQSRLWLLPFLATFTGVFSGAFLSNLEQDRASDRRFSNVLELAHQDAWQSWATANQELIRIESPEQSENSDLRFYSVPMPSIMLSALRNNPDVLSQMDTRTLSELLMLVSDIEGLIISYNSTIGKAREFEQFLRSNSRSQNMNIEQFVRTFEIDALDNIRSAEDKLARATFLLANERQRRKLLITESDFHARLESNNYCVIAHDDLTKLSCDHN
jgi:hypothetical protein